jgi:hypothetical protein
MVLSIEERMQGFLFRPSDTFDASKGDTMGDALTYFVAILLIFTAIFGTIYALYLAVLSSVITSMPGTSMPPGIGAIGPLIGVLSFVFIFLLIVVGGIISAFIWGIWTHIWVYLVGGREGVAQTIKAVMYGATPSFLLAFPPWALIVQVIAIRQFQELTTGRAILALIFAIIVPAIIMGALIAAFIATMPVPLGPEWPGYGGF